MIVHEFTHASHWPPSKVPSVSVIMGREPLTAVTPLTLKFPLSLAQNRVGEFQTKVKVAVEKMVDELNKELCNESGH